MEVEIITKKDKSILSGSSGGCNRSVHRENQASFRNEAGLADQFLLSFYTFYYSRDIWYTY